MTSIDTLLIFWLDASWPIALTIAFISNTTAYLITASCIVKISDILLGRSVLAVIDNRNLKHNQKYFEIKNGIFASAIFAILSLLTREVYSTLWPSSLVELILQCTAFIVFYETYSYFIHRLLHTKWFIKIHAIHHRSTRTTPWSAYSVHPVEAMLIGITAPLFMYLVPMSIGVAFVLHFSGMMFTIFLHSNITLRQTSPISNLANQFPNQHTKHHQVGNRNFGFVNTFWDRVFDTGD